MKKEEILDILDKNYILHRKNSFWILYFGIGAIWFSTWLLSDSRTFANGLILVLSGVIIISMALYSIIKFRKVKRDTEYAKYAVSLFPKELVWAYVKSWTDKKGKTYNQGRLNFSNGTTLVIYEDAVPEKNVGFFITALGAINPEIQIGYSKNIEQKWKNGEVVK